LGFVVDGGGGLRFMGLGWGVDGTWCVGGGGW